MLINKYSCLACGRMELLYLTLAIANSFIGRLEVVYVQCPDASDPMRFRLEVGSDPKMFY